MHIFNILKTFAEFINSIPGLRYSFPAFPIFARFAKDQPCRSLKPKISCEQSGGTLWPKSKF